MIAYPQRKSSAESRNLSSADSDYQQARLAAGQERWQEAVTCYQQVLKHDPKHLIAYQELGNVLLKLQRWQEAIACYRKALELQPNLPQIHHNLGEALSQLEQWQEAIASYHKAIELQPEFSWSHNNLADIFLKQEKWIEAIVAYKRAIELNPDFSWSHHNLGKAYLMLQQWEEAVAACQRAIELNSDYCWSYYNLAEALLHLQRWDETVAAYRQALQLQPDLPQAEERLNYALHQSVKGKLELAKYHYGKAIEQDPDNIELYHKALELQPMSPELYMGLGELLAKQREWEQAISFYQKVIELQPDCWEAYHHCGDGLLNLERWSEAVDCYQQSIELNPDFVGSYWNLGVAYSKLGNWEKVWDCYQAIDQIDSSFLDAHFVEDGQNLSEELKQAIAAYRRGEQFQQNGEQALQEICSVRNGLTLNGNSTTLNSGDLKNINLVATHPSKGTGIQMETAETYLEQGDAFRKKGKWEEALQCYQKWIELEPENWLAHHHLGDCYFQKEDWEKANISYEYAIRLNHDFHWSYCNLGRSLYNQGKLEEAVVHLKNAVEVTPQFAQAYSYLGDVEFKQEKWEEAITNYQKALELNPNLKEVEEKIEWASIRKDSIQNRNFDIQSTQVEGSTVDVRLIAFFLPQYHPIPENDEWWGKGFTEWTNVTKAKPLFEGHYQPRLPADFGFYDLRLPEVRESQAELARQYGIYGFCYYYYWFAGKRLLDRPLDEMLESKTPDFPFCLCWANENWSRRWDGSENEILIAQEHTEENNRAFAESVIPYLLDERYIRVNGKPLLIIYRANVLPEVTKTIEHWREVFREKGVGEVYLCAALTFGLQDGISLGFDAEVEFPPNTNIQRDEIDTSELKIENFGGKVYDYQSLALNTIKQPMPEKTRFPSVMLSWDNTARKKKNAHIYHNFSFSTYEFWLQSSIQKTKINYLGDERLVFINAWNEWAEGSYLEPDQENGHKYLESTRTSLNNQNNWEIYLNLIQSYQGNDYVKLEKILIGLHNSLLEKKSNTELIVEALEKEQLVFETLSKLNDDSLEWTLETPALEENLPSNFTLSGWLVCKELQPIALEIVKDGLILKQIPVDGFRKDVKDYFASYKSNNNYYSGTLRLSELKSLDFDQVDLSINVIYENGNSNTLGVLRFKRASQNLSTLKNLPNLTPSCYDLIAQIESYLHKSKPILFILHDVAAAGAQLFLVRQLEWISQNCSDVRFQVLVNIQKNCVPDYGEGGKQILERLEKVGPVYFLEGSTGLPENISSIQSNHYSLIYVNTSVLGDLLESIGKINAQVIVHIHELYFWIKYRMGIEKFNKYLKYNPKFIACSNAVQDNLVNNFNINPAQIEVIHAYVPVEKLIQSKTKSRAEVRQELNLTEDTFVIASCGTLDWRKGADLLVPLVVLLKEKLPHQKFVYLWIGGFISELAESEMDFTIKKAGLEQEILLLGHKTNPMNYLNAADLFVLLSKEDPFPLVMSEAAVCQLPTVGFDGSGGVTEFVESDAGLLAPYLNLEVMAEQIKKLYDNPKLRKEMGENAFTKINELYNESVLAPKVVQLIQSLIEASYQTNV